MGRWPVHWLWGCAPGVTPFQLVLAPAAVLPGRSASLPSVDIDTSSITVSGLSAGAFQGADGRRRKSWGGSPLARHSSRPDGGRLFQRFPRRRRRCWGSILVCTGAVPAAVLPVAAASALILSTPSPQDNVNVALSSCMKDPSLISVSELVTITGNTAASGFVDPLEHLKGSTWPRRAPAPRAHVMLLDALHSSRVRVQRHQGHGRGARCGGVHSRLFRLVCGQQRHQGQVRRALRARHGYAALREQVQLPRRALHQQLRVRPRRGPAAVVVPGKACGPGRWGRGPGRIRPV